MPKLFYNLFSQKGNQIIYILNFSQRHELPNTCPPCKHVNSKSIHVSIIHYKSILLLKNFDEIYYYYYYYTILQLIACFGNFSPLKVLNSLTTLKYCHFQKSNVRCMFGIFGTRPAWCFGIFNEII